MACCISKSRKSSEFFVIGLPPVKIPDIINAIPFYHMRGKELRCVMKILILSDSHSSMHFMRRAVMLIRPAHVIHLGDYYDDGDVLARENPHICFHQVPGNCDRGYCDPALPQLLCYDV
ncbi:MAG: metallophosphoesterase family protein, partial [Ruminococcaceae bacterium]|nr:metallophosphoesterase family protein [Oscillospiraceae bacterium]